MIDTECTKIKLSKREMKLLQKVKKKSVLYTKEYDALLSIKPKLIYVSKTKPDGYGGYVYTPESKVFINETGKYYLKSTSLLRRFGKTVINIMPGLNALVSLIKSLFRP